MTGKTTLRSRLRASGAEEIERERRLSAALMSAGSHRLHEIARWLAITAMAAFLVLAFVGPRWAQGVAITTGVVALLGLEALGRRALRAQCVPDGGETK